MFLKFSSCLKITSVDLKLNRPFCTIGYCYNEVVKDIGVINFVLLDCELEEVMNHICFQVIPGNLQKYVSTNHIILQCKTLPAHFSDNMMVYCLLNAIFKSTMNGGCAFKRA